MLDRVEPSPRNLVALIIPLDASIVIPDPTLISEKVDTPEISRLLAVMIPITFALPRTSQFVGGSGAYPDMITNNENFIVNLDSIPEIKSLSYIRHLIRIFIYLSRFSSSTSALSSLIASIRSGHFHIEL